MADLYERQALPVAAVDERKGESVKCGSLIKMTNQQNQATTTTTTPTMTTHFILLNTFISCSVRSCFRNFNRQGASRTQTARTVPWTIFGLLLFSKSLMWMIFFPALGRALCASISFNLSIAFKWQNALLLWLLFVAVCKATTTTTTAQNNFSMP